MTSTDSTAVSVNLPSADSDEEYNRWIKEEKNIPVQHLDYDGNFYDRQSVFLTQDERKQLLIDLAAKNTTGFTSEILERMRNTDTDRNNTECLRYWIEYLKHGENVMDTLNYLIDQEEFGMIEWRWTNPWTYNREEATARMNRRKTMSKVQAHFDFLKHSHECGEVSDEVLIYMIRQRADSVEESDWAKAARLHDAADYIARINMTEYAYQLNLETECWKHPKNWMVDGGFQKMANDHLDKILSFLHPYFPGATTYVTRRYLFGGISIDGLKYLNNCWYRGSSELLEELKKLTTSDERIKCLKERAVIWMPAYNRALLCAEALM